MLGGLAASLLFAEGAFQIREQLFDVPKTMPLEQPTKSPFGRFHPVIGMVGLENIERQHLGRTITHNSRGLRGPVVPFKRTERPRVVFLGDSLLWGYALEDGTTIPEVAARRLERRTGIRPEIVNLGLSGYGTDQSLLQYLLNGRRYQPDMVVFLACQNDSQEDRLTKFWGIHKPRFDIYRGELCLENVPVPRQNGWENNRIWPPSRRHVGVAGLPFSFNLAETAVFRFLMGREWSLGLLEWTHREGLTEIRGQMNCIRAEPRRRRQPDITTRLVQELHRRVNEDGAKLAIFLAPPRRMETAEQGYRPYRKLRETKTFSVHSLFETTEGKPEYYMDRYHFNKWGAARIGRAIADRIEAKLPPSSSRPHTQAGLR